MVRVAINGFGRIGRAFLKLAHERDDIEIVAINDLGDIENLAYLLRYDSVYGKWEHAIEVSDGTLTVDGQAIQFLNEREPSALPWGALNIDVVVEATGVFRTYEASRAHVDAGAKRVVISAPVKDEPPSDLVGATVLMGVNNDALKTCTISANASCTTNAGSPLMAILSEEIGIERALLNTVHGYTASQSLVDAPNKDWRRGRAGAHNMVPTTTGAAVATTKALPELTGKFDGIAIRIPLVVGSLADITCIASRETSAEEVNDILRRAATEERWKEIFSVTEEPIVSTDIINSRYASIADLSFTRVIGNLVKVLSWYDNEVGYTNTLVAHVVQTGTHAQTTPATGA